MVDKTGQSKNPSDDDPQKTRLKKTDVTENEGDLNFATDSQLGQHHGNDEPSESDLPAAEGNDASDADVNKTWVPSSTPTVDGLENNADDPPSDSVEDTWVVGDDGTASPPAASADKPSEERSVEDTWVPPEAGSAAADSTEDAVEKTWVPSSTPTVDGLENNADVPPSDSVEDTWVVGEDGTASPPAVSADEPSEERSIEDTWVPPEAGSAAADSTEDAVEKTWVPSTTPTHHDFAHEGGVTDSKAESDDADVSKTFVPSTTPTLHGAQSERGEASDATGDNFDSVDVYERTAVIPPDSDTSDANASDGHEGTVVLTDEQRAAMVADDGTVIFSRTMGMRGLSEEEYNNWQSDVSERSASDTDVFGAPDATSSDSALGRGTQIWSHQTAAGLDEALTIRNRPVAGEKTLENSSVTDKPDYQVLEKLAEGGMGAIYVAKQTSLDREIAIKTLKPLKEQERKAHQSQGRTSQVNRQRREMFLSEALVTANLVHPHIIPIHDLCETGEESPFYVMKRVHGTPWNERIRDMSLEENLEVLHKVCDAMAYAHHNGVVNRDLKPENIMLGEFGEVLVLDWGLAVPATQSIRKQFASPSASFGAGTPAYMSPELWTGPPEKIGTWSDIYLLGAILFEIVVGKPPHQFPETDSKAGASGLWKVIDNVVRRNEIRETNEEGELFEIAMQAMNTEPRLRYPSVLKFQEAVKSYQKHEESRHLSRKASQTLQDAPQHAQVRGYQDYQTAAALFEEAFNEWPANIEARNGLRNTRLAYAQLAQRRGDYELGLQIAAKETEQEFQDLTAKLSRARALRNGLKYATMAAIAVVVIVGAVSFVQRIEIAKQNAQITAQNEEIRTLFGDKTSLEADKKKLVSDKQSLVAEKDELQVQKEQLIAEQTELLTEKESLVQEKTILIADKDRLQKESSTLQQQRNLLMKEKDSLVAQKDVLEKDKTRLETQQQQLVAEITRVEKEKTAIAADVAALAKEKVRADVELRNASIASLIRNADYATALKRVEDLLAALENDPRLADLPADERKQRQSELQARRRQLLKRTIPSEDPVQTQVISPSGKIVVWGDSAGRLTVRAIDTQSGEVASEPSHQLNIENAVRSVHISADDQLIVAASGQQLHFWKPADNEHTTISDHDSRITTVRLTHNLAVAADAGGSIRAWRLADQQEAWSIRTTAAIRDIAIMPTANVLLYAGSRGGESADVLAYQLPDSSDSQTRPQRLGQLRFPRDRIDPPRRIVVSQDESTLFISNSRNGEMIFLPRVVDDQTEARDRFPFVHAADLDRQAQNDWITAQHQRPVNDIGFSADGQRVVTASDDRTIVVWNIESQGQKRTLTMLQRLEGHGARVTAAAFIDASGQKVLSTSSDRLCRVWDVENYSEQRRAIEAVFDLAATFPINPAQPLPQINRRSEAYILTKSPSVQEEQPSAEKQSEYLVLNQNRNVQRGALQAVAITADGRRVVTGAADGTAVIWDGVNGDVIQGVSPRSSFETERPAFDEGHDFNVARLRFVPPDGRVILTTGFDGNLCLWNADTRKSGAGHQELRIPGLGLVNAVATSADGSSIATSTGKDRDQRSGSVSIWEISDLMTQQTPEAVVELTGFHRADVSAIAFDSAGQKVATGARDGRVAIWDLSDGRLIAGGQLHAKNTIVSHVEWLPSGHVLSAGFDGRLQILDGHLSGSVPPADTRQPTTPSVQLRFQHDRIPVERVAFSQSKQRFATVSVRTDRATKETISELRLWDVEKDVPIQSIRTAIVKGRSAGRIGSISWSSDDKILAAVVDGNLQLFDTASWKVLKVLAAPGLGISDAVFAPRKNSSATIQNMIATFDGTAAHLWNLADYSHIADFRPLFAVQSVAIAQQPDVSLLLTGDRAIRVFDANQQHANFGSTLSKVSDPHRGVVTSLNFAPAAKNSDDSPMFVSTGADGSAALWQWDINAGNPTLLHWLKRNGPAVVASCWSTTGNCLLIASDDGTATVYDVQNQPSIKATWKIDTAEDVTISSAAISHDGQAVAIAGQFAASGESTAWVYRLTGEAEVQLHCTITGHEAGGINGIRFLSHSPYIVTGGADGNVIIWNWQPGRVSEGSLAAYEAYQFLVEDRSRAHEGAIRSLSVSQNGRIVTSSDDGTAIVWRSPFAAITMSSDTP